MVTVRPTQTPRLILSIAPTFTPVFLAPTAQPPGTPTRRPPTATFIPSDQPLATVGTLGTPTATFVITRQPASNTFSLGRSVQGRDLLAWEFGQGNQTLLLVGGIHAGFEANTVQLLNELIAHFESTPADVLPGIKLVLVPVLNPDGLVMGRKAEGRLNANSVDLNRNWGCDWSAEAYWQNNQVDPGPRAFSEPETLGLAQWIRENRPAVALFYHSAARGVFEGTCPTGGVSHEMAEVLGKATGYPYDQPFSAYTVTGTESNWVDGLGIPSADVELSTTRDSELVVNLKGIMALQCWLIANAAPRCEE